VDDRQVLGARSGAPGCALGIVPAGRMEARPYETLDRWYSQNLSSSSRSEYFVVTTEVDVIDYAVPGPLTNLDTIDTAVLEPVSGHPREICFPMHTLVIQPDDARSIGMPSERFSENQLRPAAGLVQALLALDAAPLSTPREPEKRVIGTCRHFAVLSCALLRYRGNPSRVGDSRAQG